MNGLDFFLFAVYEHLHTHVLLEYEYVLRERIRIAAMMRGIGVIRFILIHSLYLRI